MSWIKVEDEFPEVGTGVLGYFAIKQTNLWIITVCIFNGEQFETIDFWDDDVVRNIEVTYWMPLPKPPKD
jgi:hypothetical protein